MNRLQKKCAMASTAMHAILLAVVLVGPAFMIVDEKANNLPLLKIIPMGVTAEEAFGGGSPTAKPPLTPEMETPKTIPAPAVGPPKSPPQAEVQEKPAAEPTKDPAKPIKPAPLPEPVVLKDSAARPDTSKPKPQIKVDTKVVPRTPKDIAEAREKAAAEAARAEAKEQARAAEARQKAIQQFARTIDGAADSLNANLSQGTTVEMPGPGGAAYANYGQVIKSIYQNAWIDPLDGSNSATTVQAEIVIAHDGTWISDRIIKRSGDVPLDQSVQNALSRARAVRFPAFPKGAKDSKRTFIINFNLREKLDVG